MAKKRKTEILYVDEGPAWRRGTILGWGKTGCGGRPGTDEKILRVSSALDNPAGSYVDLTKLQVRAKTKPVGGVPDMGGRRVGADWYGSIDAGTTLTIFGLPSCGITVHEAGNPDSPTIDMDEGGAFTFSAETPGSYILQIDSARYLSEVYYVSVL